MSGEVCAQHADMAKNVDIAFTKIDRLMEITARNTENIARALKSGGVWDCGNPSVITPRQLSRFPIYSRGACQIKGDECPIPYEAE